MSEVDLAAVHSLMMRGHVGQFRADGVTPYHTHPEAVFQIAKSAYQVSDPEIVNDPLFEALCKLHDVPEDCSKLGFEFTIEGIAQNIHPTLGLWLPYLTKPPMPPEFNSARGEERTRMKLAFNRESHKKIAACPYRPVQLAKFGDRAHNIQSLPSAKPFFRQWYVTDTLAMIEECRDVAGIEFVKTQLNMFRDGLL